MESELEKVVWYTLGCGFLSAVEHFEEMTLTDSLNLQEGALYVL